MSLRPIQSVKPIYLLRLTLLCLCSLSIFSFAFSTKKALAFDSPITIVSHSDIIHFPNYIDFTMTANDTASTITSAIIYITFNDVPYSNDMPYPVTISKPAQRITLTFRDDTSHESNFHSPGTPVAYYWVLQDNASHKFAELPQDFTTIDTRFQWQHLTQGLLQVNWYGRPAAFGQLLLNKANASITHISSVLGSGLQHPINLWVYASNGDFHGALAPNSYEWVGGEAHPFLNEAFISVVDENDDTLIRDMPHELTHLVFHQLIVQGPVPPTWFDEGLAVYNQLYHEPDMRARFLQALTTRSLLRLYSITDGFPSDADQAYLAYAQSWDLIDYMYKTFGQAKMALLIQKMNNVQTDFDQQLTQAIGLDALHLENQWRLQLNQSSVLTADQLTPTPKPITQPTPTPTNAIDSTTPILITAGTLLILLPILGIVAIFVYQRRKRQQVLAGQGAQSYRTPNPMVQPISQSVPNGAYNQHNQPNNANPTHYMPSGQQESYSYLQAQNGWPAANLPPTSQTYMPFSYPGAEQPVSAPPQMPPQQQNQQPGQPPQRIPTSTPAFQWPAEYPTPNDEYFVANGNIGQPASETFGQFQERIQQQPRKRAPQE